MVNKVSKVEFEKERAELRELIKPGDTLYTILRHVSASGMSRDISVVYITKDGETRQLDYSTHVLTGYPLSKHDGVKVGGCGMDMGFSLVYHLSQILYGDGYPCLGEHKCPSPEHVNSGPLRHVYDGRIHKDGYAISQRWL
jgi:hypothetical protein